MKLKNNDVNLRRDLKPFKQLDANFIQIHIVVDIYTLLCDKVFLYKDNTLFEKLLPKRTKFICRFFLLLLFSPRPLAVSYAQKNMVLENSFRSITAFIS